MEVVGELDALIIEVSFPDELEGLALKTGHLTPGLLLIELNKLPVPPRRILVSHLKPQHDTTIREQLRGLEIRNLEFLSDGATHKIMVGGE